MWLPLIFSSIWFLLIFHGSISKWLWYKTLLIYIFSLAVWTAWFMVSDRAAWALIKYYDAKYTNPCPEWILQDAGYNDKGDIVSWYYGREDEAACRVRLGL